jgi:hypothetical protein
MGRQRLNASKPVAAISQQHISTQLSLFLPPFFHDKKSPCCLLVTMSQYKSIPVVTLDVEQNDDEIRISDEEQHRQLPPYTKVGMFIGTVMLLSIAIISRTTGTSSAEADGILLLGASNSAPACTFSECFASNCNWESAPYTCLLWNGGPHGGCSQVPWIEGTCTTQCDLSGCADYVIPDDEESCDVPCDEAWCGTGRLCGSDVPYQCTTGASTFGCSSDEYQWTLISSSASCSACCDVNTCA